MGNNCEGWIRNVLSGRVRGQRGEITDTQQPAKKNVRHVHQGEFQMT